MYDIIIIGSGPAGLSAAVYARRANLDIAVVEKEYEGSGQIAESGNVNNYLGLPNINGYELGEKFRNHALSLEVSFIEKEALRISKIETAGQTEYEVEFDDGSVENAKAIVYTAGAYPRKTDIKGEEEFLGRGLSYCAICDGAFYKGKTAAVLGGGDTALDDALYLSDICQKVYVVHRRDKFRGAQSTVELLKKRENVEFILNDSVVEIQGDKKLSSITLKSGKNLAADGVFAAYGSVPQTKLVEGLVELDERGYVKALEDGITHTPDGSRIQAGFYVAGDARTKRLRQVSTAVSDGANAIYSATEYLQTRGKGNEI